MRGSTDGSPSEQVYFGGVIEGRRGARRGEQNRHANDHRPHPQPRVWTGSY